MKDDFLTWLYQYPIATSFEKMLILKAKYLQYDSNINYIHITGTNGKGSVARYLNKALTTFTNEKVALFTSPHISKVNERIVVNNICISDNDLSRIKTIIASDVDKYQLSFFAILTLIGLIYFQEQQVKWAIIEVGIGGLYDSTNIISSDYVVLTSLSYDHQQLLGTTLPAILQQKLGIIKTTTKKVFVSKTIAVFLQKIIIRTILNQELIFSNCNTKNYLTNNLDLAFVITKHLLPHVTSSKLKLTLKKTKNRLRFQKIVFANKVLYFDVAHNNAGVKAVKMLLDYQKINVDKVIFSCLIDKNKTLLLKTLRKITNNIVICRNSHFRSIDGAEFNFNEMIKEDKKNMIFLIIGSCYFVADVYNKFITYSKKV